MLNKETIKDILETLKQEDYELWIQSQGKSHLSEEQWNYVIKNFNERLDKLEEVVEDK